MKVSADGFSFNFTNALNAFKFDEKNPKEPTFHGVPMKAVDVVVEFKDFHLYVEIKDFHNPDMYDVSLYEDEVTIKDARSNFRWLKNYLKYKYRDSFLYRHAEQKVDKPIIYICLLTFSDAFNLTMKKMLHTELPVGIASPRWKQAIVKGCHVVNLEKWNEEFPKWPVTKIPTQTG